jgi:hypothetical protein
MGLLGVDGSSLASSFPSAGFSASFFSPPLFSKSEKEVFCPAKAANPDAPSLKALNPPPAEGLVFGGVDVGVVEVKADLVIPSCDGVPNAGAPAALAKDDLATPS